ncbi:MAG: hypothetical protein WCE21_01155 [Candidatus Babeliales bacterium]
MNMLRATVVLISVALSSGLEGSQEASKRPYMDKYMAQSELKKKCDCYDAGFRAYIPFWYDKEKNACEVLEKFLASCSEISNKEIQKNAADQSVMKSPAAQDIHLSALQIIAEIAGMEAVYRQLEQAYNLSVSLEVLLKDMSHDIAAKEITNLIKIMRKINENRNMSSEQKLEALQRYGIRK